MCGVVQQSGSDSELVVPPDPSSTMPPSITVRSDSNKGCSPPAGDAPLHGREGSNNDKAIPTIDIASDNDGDDDLQKAIALSLLDQEQEITIVSGLSSEDQQVSRALEASLKDAKPQSALDNLHLQNCKREGKTPVGLQNIGNSCWFNVVIQTLWHIPVFRDLILNYKLPDNTQDEENVKDVLPNVVCLLRQLFALLIASERKFVNPTEAVNVFQDQEMRKDVQQDVCEFIHKLLEKLENEFQRILKHQGIEKESSDICASRGPNFNNPIINFFYGQSCNEINRDDTGSKYITFGQYLLHVMNYKDIHESILASMSQNVSEISCKDTVLPIQQETWFKRLPPILIFSLSRYEYSKEKKRTEKVHNKFEFPQCLYMDRYMEVNKQIIKEKHIKVAKLKEELNSLIKVLDKYMKFGSGDEKYPLNDILKYTLEFARSNQTFKSDDICVPSPSKMDVDSVESYEQTDVEMTDELELKKNPTSQVNDQKLVIEEESLDLDQKTTEIPSPSKKMRVLPPTPGYMNANELLVLESCLPRWQNEIEKQLEELQKDIKTVKDQLDNMFEVDNLKQVPYKLHAVVVHEGQASAGHYWVYIYDKNMNVWMKFNDVQVCESKWEEVLHDSVGGQNNASAYCLIYLDESRNDIMFPDSHTNLEQVFSNMPLELQEYVKKDNLHFQHDNTNTIPVTAPNSPISSQFTEFKESKKSAQFTEFKVPKQSEDDTFFVDIETLTSMAVRKNFKNENVLDSDLDMVGEYISSQVKRQKTFAENHDCGSMLDLGIYIFKNEPQNEKLVRVYCCDVLTQSVTHRSISYQISQKVIPHFCRIVDENIKEDYAAWKLLYKDLIQCILFLLEGFNCFKCQHYEKAMNYIGGAYYLYSCLEKNSRAKNNKPLDKFLLSKCRRLCILEYNSKLKENFVRAQNKDDQVLQNISECVCEYIVPALSQLEESSIEEDAEAADKIRSTWCSLLDSKESRYLQQILEGVLNNGSCDKLTPPKIDHLRHSGYRILDVYKQFKEFRKCVVEKSEQSVQCC